jgi:colanic acid/amylovoran biosynthesis glycosyltransferase
MKIAYLTTTYPSVSHTFIRRELNELERQLGAIERFAIRRSPFAIVDAEDAVEDGKTFHVLSQPLQLWLGAMLRRGVRHPLALGRGLARSMSLARRGHRGLARHLAYWLEAIFLLDEMAKRGVEHVHVHFGTNPTSVAQILRAMGGPTYSFTVHGPDEFDEPVGFSLGSKIEEAAFVVAISHYSAAQLRRWVSYSEWEKIRLVHCTVGDEFFQQAAPIASDSKAFVCVGRLSPQKGQLLLIEAFADALDQGLEASLVLVGDGELRPEIEALIAQRGVAHKVRITGWCDGPQVRQELLASRALVLPSFAEGLPVVIMEAFALGRPVLSTYVAGIPELVRNGENGWLVPAGSREALTEAMVSVIRTPTPELDRMAARGQALVRQLHYTPTETAKLAVHMRRACASASPAARPSEAARADATARHRTLTPVPVAQQNGAGRPR